MTSSLSPHQTINLELVEKLVLVFLYDNEIPTPIPDLPYMLRLAKSQWKKIISKIQDRIYDRYLDIALIYPISTFVSDPNNISETYLKSGRLRIALDKNVSKYPASANIIEEGGEYYFPINNPQDTIELSTILSLFPNDNTFINLKIDSDITLDIPWQENLHRMKQSLNKIQKNIQVKTFKDFENCFKKMKTK